MWRVHVSLTTPMPCFLPGAVITLDMLATVTITNTANCQRVSNLGHEVLVLLDNAGEHHGTDVDFFVSNQKLRAELEVFDAHTILQWIRAQELSLGGTCSRDMHPTAVFVIKWVQC